MAEETKIGWTEFTVNAWEGCMKVGPGCDHCYAEADNKHWRKGANWGPHAPRRRVKNCYEKLNAASRAAIKSGHKMRVFTSSISDIFEKPYPVEGEPDITTHDLRLEYFKAIEQHPELTFLLLTKRPQNITKYIPEHWHAALPSNVWFGCTMVNQEEADRDIAHLLQAPGIGNKFLSIEPMLGPIELDAIWIDCPTCNGSMTSIVDESGGHVCGNCLHPIAAFRQGKVSGISWIIVGFESGHGARKGNPEWARSINRQCLEARVPFFFKQWGVYAPNGQTYTDGNGITHEVMQRGKNTGNLLDGKIHEEYPTSMTAAI